MIDAMLPVTVTANSSNIKPSVWAPSHSVDTGFQSLYKAEQSTLVLAIYFFYENSFYPTIGHFAMNHLTFIWAIIQCEWSRRGIADFILR